MNFLTSPSDPEPRFLKAVSFVATTKYPSYDAAKAMQASPINQNVGFLHLLVAQILLDSNLLELASRIAPPLLEAVSMIDHREAQALIEKQQEYLRSVFSEYCSVGRGSVDTSSAGKNRMPIRCLQSLALDVALVPNIISKQGAHSRHVHAL
jgi:hypothetical protein